MSHLLVTDTTCLIALDRVGRLDFLPRLYGSVVAPPAVIQEFGQRPAWLRQERLGDDAGVDALRAVLDAGEAEAIVLASRLPDAVLLIDEARGRRVAVERGLQIIGTAGVLLGAKRAGFIPHLKPVLDEMRERHAFRLSDVLYKHFVREAGEA